MSSHFAGIPSYAGLENAHDLRFTEQVERTITVSPNIGFVSNPDLKLLVEDPHDPIVFITDTTVNELYCNQLVDSLQEKGANIVQKLVLPASELAKTVKVYTNCLYSLERNPLVTADVTLVALGGAVVSNVTGFLAATLKRGVRFVSIPTTLLAQCDGCISFKQAVNGAVAKNQFGSFYAPAKIILDMQVLDTLEDRNFLDGFGEIIKHALCQDMKMVTELEGVDVDAMIVDRSVCYPLIWKAVQCKIECMRNCPPENHAVLQYGHQYGHGIEKAAHFRFGHGECVGLGMVATDYLGMIMRYNSKARLDRTTALVEKYRLPTFIDGDVSLDSVWDAMIHDKAYKNNQHRVNFAEPLVKNGEFIVIPDERIRQGLSYISSSQLMFYNGSVVSKTAVGVASGQGLLDAVEAGHRHLVCTENVSDVGEGLRAALEHEAVTRANLTLAAFITATPECDVLSLYQDILRTLGLERLDIALLDMSSVRHLQGNSLSRMWQVMETLVGSGLADNIGVANCSTSQLKALCKHCQIKPVCNQLTSFKQSQLGTLYATCEKLNVRLITHHSNIPCSSLPAAAQLADTLGITPEQLLLRYITANGVGLVLHGDLATPQNFALDFSLPVWARDRCGKLAAPLPDSTTTPSAALFNMRWLALKAVSIQAKL